MSRELLTGTRIDTVGDCSTKPVEQATEVVVLVVETTVSVNDTLPTCLAAVDADIDVVIGTLRQLGTRLPTQLTNIRGSDVPSPSTDRNAS